MSDTFDLKKFGRNVKAALMTTPDITIYQLKKNYQARTGLEMPLDQLPGTLEQVLEDLDCVQQGGKWRYVGKKTKNAENLSKNLEQMEPPKNARGGGGDRPHGGPSRFTANDNAASNSRSRAPAYDSQRQFPPTGTANGTYQPSKPETNFTNRYEFSNGRNDRPDDRNYDDMNCQDVRGGNSNWTTNGNNNNDYISDNERPRPEINETVNSDNDSDDDFTSMPPPPGLVPNSGYRPDSAASRDQRPSTSAEVKKPIGAKFYFPPPPVRQQSPAPPTPPIPSSSSGKADKTDELDYDELCPEILDVLLESWPAALTAEELMNELAMKPSLEKWAERLMGPKLMEYSTKLIDVINNEQECILIKDTNEGKVYSLIPGTPDAANEQDLYEQIGKMLCLILKQHGKMDIESIQAHLGLTDDGGPDISLNACSLILEAAKHNPNIITGPTTFEENLRRLSLRFGVSVAGLRSQIKIRPANFRSKEDQSNGTASCSNVDKVADLLSQCEGYISDNFPIFEQHPLIEKGPSEDNDLFKCTLVYYSNLDKFTVRLVDDNNDYEMMQKYLEEDYDGVVWDERLCKYTKEGAAVGVKMEEGKFARGIVYYYDRNPKERSFVYLVDEGYLNEVSIVNIFPLKDSLKTRPPMGIKCTIGSFQTTPDRIDKYYEEHQEIWKTLNKPGFISISALDVMSCGSKKELLVSFSFSNEQEVYKYPSDLVNEGIITPI